MRKEVLTSTSHITGHTQYAMGSRDAAWQLVGKTEDLQGSMLLRDALGQSGRASWRR